MSHARQFDDGDKDQKLKARQLGYLTAAEDIVTWFNDWVWTYDPREGGGGLMPFILFPKQAE